MKNKTFSFLKLPTSIFNSCTLNFVKLRVIPRLFVRLVMITKLLVWNLIILSESVLKSKFKTCKESGFCNRNYHQKLQENRFSAKNIKCSGGIISAILQDHLLKNELVFYAMAVENNRFRIHMTELDPMFPRFDVFKDGWKSLQKEPPILRSVITDKLSLYSCSFTFSTNYVILISFSPLKIEIYNEKKELVMSFNSNNSFYIEPQIRKLNTQNTDEGLTQDTPSNNSGDSLSHEFEINEGNETIEHDIPNESFDGHTDSLPHGYQAVSFDSTFHNFSHIYGLPEHGDTFSLNTKDSLYRLFNLDVFEYELHNQMALYGSVPFVIAKNKNLSIGLLFLNAAEMWVSLNKVSSNSILSFLGLKSKHPSSNISTRWIAESGNIDIIVMLGPHPKEVLYQYSLTTGFPTLPPLFSLAYHQCRWNYNDQNDIRQVDAKFDEYSIPYDTIWLDIEHTPERMYYKRYDERYFKWDSSKFSDPLHMITDISKKGRKMVTVVDPHVKKSESYHVYKEAIEKNLQSRNKHNETYVGWCWPGDSIYPDYMRSEVRKWYASLFALDKYEGSTVDLHTWVDMNEPSVFNGPEVTVPKDLTHGQWENRDVHNLYAQMCVEAAYQGGLVRSNNKLRPFVHKNMCSWNSFCWRWYQAASMQPFFRAHSHIETKRREPWSYGSPTTELVKEQILRRYRYLPYIYTVFYEATKHGIPVMRPLWFEFPNDDHTFDIEDCYMLGSSLLIKPIVSPKTFSINIYFPSSDSKQDYWWGLVDNVAYSSGSQHNIPFPSISDLPMFQRSGTIIPTWERQRRSSSKMINDPITLNVVVDSNNRANGSFYFDDTESFEYKSGRFSLFSFQYYNGLLSGGAVEMFSTKIWLERVRIYGLKNTNTIAAHIVSNGRSAQLRVQQSDKVLIIRKPGVKLKDGFSIRYLTLDDQK
ncbi:hypothetical protein MXB_2664 [Myxobolus squamalis]|nr:hypothetical protein MXB_2664 [Myxobolus squamalis]